MSKILQAIKSRDLVDELAAQYEYLSTERDKIYPLLRQITLLDKTVMSQTELREQFVSYCIDREDQDLPDPSLAETISMTQEAVMQPPWLYMAVRKGRSNWHYLKLHVEEMLHELVSVRDYLVFKEHVLGGIKKPNDWVLELDLSKFDQDLAKISDTAAIGEGFDFSHRYFFAEVFTDHSAGCNNFINYLRNFEFKGQQLFLNPRVETLDECKQSLHFAIEFLRKQSLKLSWSQISFQLQAFSIEPGWGNSVDSALESLQTFRQFIDSPEPILLKKILSKIPTLFSIVVVLPHGFLSQGNVLGLPDTDGALIYLFDQVKAIEQALRRNIQGYGVNVEPEIVVISRLIPESLQTTCSLTEEKIVSCKNAKIIRIPFKSKDGQHLQQWIARDEVWPYLEQFAFDAKTEIRGVLARSPDLIIGHSTAGNLVASLLSRSLNCIQCNIAHWLQKPEDNFSDALWYDSNKSSHMGCQYTADLIAMNCADIIVTNTSHEIVGREDSVGQYELYKSFTMPGLYRVINGLDLHDHRFNCVPPGVCKDIFFPYLNKSQRLKGLESEITSLVYGDVDKKSRGSFTDLNKRMLFTLAGCLGKNKNISGLVDWYGKNHDLQKQANLLLVTGHLDLASSYDHQEQSEIKRIHKLIDQYQLEDKVRWIGRYLERNLLGELYRYVADMQGIFVQPSLFEAFSLTVLEAMACGLPCFVTKYGGPVEIVVDGVSGFHIDPKQGEHSCKIISRFFEQCDKDNDYWQKISEAAIARVDECYNWQRHSRKLISLAKLANFWSSLNKGQLEQTKLYMNMLYGLQYRKLAAKIETDVRRQSISSVTLLSNNK